MLNHTRRPDILRLRLACTTAVLIAGCATAGQAAAAEPAAQPPAEPGSSLSEVLVTARRAEGLNLDKPSTAGSRLALSALDTPATVTVIDGELVRARGDRTILDAISRAPGIVAGPVVGNGNSFFSSRGFYGSTAVMTLYDGVLLRLSGNTAVFPFDPWNVERIEILSGPASVLYGTGATGGVVNTITKKADPKSFHGEVELEGGSFGTYQEAFDVTGPITPWLSGRLNVSNRTSDGFVDHGGSHSLAISGALRAEIRPNLIVTLSEDAGDQHLSTYEGSVIANGAPVPGLEHKNFNVAGAHIANNTTLTMLKEEWKPLSNVSVTNYTYFTGIERPFLDATNYTYLPATQQVRITGFRNISNQYSYQYGDSGFVSIDTKLFGLKNDFLLGFDVNKARYRRADNTSAAGGFVGTATVSAFTYVPIAFSAGNAPARVVRFLSGADGAGVFGEDRVELTDKLSVVGGLRFDHYGAQNSDIVLKTLAITSQDNLNGHVGAVYKVTPRLSLFAQYATSTDPFSNLASVSVAQQAFKLTTGKEYEFGIKQTLWGDRLSYTVSAYDIIKKNVVTPSFDNPSISVQAGEQEAAGVEGAVSLALRSVSLGANATVLDPHFNSFVAVVGGKATSLKGFTPAFVPDQSANLWASWDFLPKWQVRGEVRYVGKRYSDNTDLSPLKEYTVVGLDLRWLVSPRWRLDLRVDNAFDATYAESANAATATAFILGEPRAVSIRSNVNF